MLEEQLGESICIYIYRVYVYVDQKYKIKSNSSATSNRLQWLEDRVKQLEESERKKVEQLEKAHSDMSALVESHKQQLLQLHDDDTLMKSKAITVVLIVNDSHYAFR